MMCSMRERRDVFTASMLESACDFFTIFFFLPQKHLAQDFEFIMFLDLEKKWVVEMEGNRRYG